MSIKFRARNSGKIWDSEHCLRGLNVLGHSQLIELFIGSECGGHGRCGKDRVLTSKKDQIHFNPPTQIEKLHLSDQEIGEGWRLACQCFPAEDGLDLRVEFQG